VALPAGFASALGAAAIGVADDDEAGFIPVSGSLVEGELELAPQPTASDAPSQAPAQHNPTRRFMKSPSGTAPGIIGYLTRHLRARGNSAPCGEFVQLAAHCKIRSLQDTF